MRDGPTVSVVIPVWNEDLRSLRALYARLQRVLDVWATSWELLLVDDGSQERTAQALRALAEEDPRIHLLRFERRRGQEAALVAGMLAACGTFICTMDCDLEHRPEDLPRMLAPLMEGCDLVLGRRRSLRNLSLARRLISKIYTVIMNIRWGVGLRDWGCGFNVLRGVLLDRVRPHVLRRPVEGPLKRTFIRCAARWAEVTVTPDVRRYGRSGYRGARFLRHAIRMVLFGTSSSSDGGEGAFSTAALTSSASGVLSQARRFPLAHPVRCELVGDERAD